MEARKNSKKTPLDYLEEALEEETKLSGMTTGKRKDIIFELSPIQWRLLLKYDKSFRSVNIPEIYIEADSNLTESFSDFYFFRGYNIGLGKSFTMHRIDLSDEDSSFNRYNRMKERENGDQSYKLQPRLKSYNPSEDPGLTIALTRFNKIYVSGHAKRKKRSEE